MSVDATKRVCIIGGPTASGKSACALAMAQRENGVIINADSRQIFKDLPILSAQPTEEDKAILPHALYGILGPNDHNSAGAWQKRAVEEIKTVFEAGQMPIVTGGTGLYLKSLMEGLSPIPAVDDSYRKKAIALQKELGNPAFHKALAERDPQTAALYHPMNTARLIHAWEILDQTGIPLSIWQAMPRETPPQEWHFDVFLVLPPREMLYKACHDRFIAMVEAGAVEELAAFDQKLEKGIIRPDSILIKTLGATPLRLWRNGALSREEAIAHAATETRHYAKRQVTWFRHQTPAPSAPVTRVTCIEDVGNFIASLPEQS